MTPALCKWCSAPLPSGRRRDALFCGKGHRQAHWRFARRLHLAEATDRPLRLGYADPAYPGCAAYYPEGEEVDHGALVAQLREECPDGWALSTSAEALLEVWSLCPEARLGVWFCSVRRTRSARPLSSFEPVLFCGGRPLPTDKPQRLIDSLTYRGRYRAFPGALIGMKPPEFSQWVFQSLGARRGDTLTDFFPGSGAVTKAWEIVTGEASPAAGGDPSAMAAGDTSPRTSGDGAPRYSREESRQTTP